MIVHDRWSGDHLLSITPLSCHHLRIALSSPGWNAPALGRRMMKINHKGTPAAPNHARVGPIAPYIGRFAKFLASEGYVAFTINAKLSLVTALSRWLKRHGLPLVELDERTLKQFYNYCSASIGAATYLPAVSCWSFCVPPNSFLRRR